jgi:putative membrane protein
VTEPDTDRELETLRDRSHPDYRFSLANERTFLAWCRTSLALLAGGIGVVYLPSGDVLPVGRRILGVLLVVLGMLAAGGSYYRWRANHNAIERGTPLPPSRGLALMAAGLTAVAVLALALVIANL